MYNYPFDDPESEYEFVKAAFEALTPDQRRVLLNLMEIMIPPKEADDNG